VKPPGPLLPPRMGFREVVLAHLASRARLPVGVGGSSEPPARGTPTPFTVRPPGQPTYTVNIELPLPTVLCLDPGHTTGWAMFHDGFLIGAGQQHTYGAPEADRLIRSMGLLAQNKNLTITVVVLEAYHIYAHRLQQHVNSDVPTLQIIGAIKAAISREKAYRMATIEEQMAFQAKRFADDKKLRAWKLYQQEKKHANDAIRHGVYWHVFGLQPTEAHQARDRQTRAKKRAGRLGHTVG
jgi:hypothetical protein